MANSGSRIGSSSALIPVSRNDTQKQFNVRFGSLAGLTFAILLLLAYIECFDLFVLWLFTQPGLSLPLGLLILFIYGLIGNEFGISKLFLLPSFRVRVIGGISVSLFASLVLSASYLADTDMRASNAHFSKVIRAYERVHLAWLVGSPDTSPETTEEDLKAQSIRNPSEILWRLSAFLNLATPMLLLVLAVPGLPFAAFGFQMPQEGATTDETASPPPQRQAATGSKLHGLLRYVSGWSMALAGGTVAAQLLFIVPGYVLAPFQGQILSMGGADALDQQNLLMIRTFATVVALAAIVWGIFIFLRIRYRRGYPASVAITSLLSMIVLVYLLSQSIGDAIAIYQDFFTARVFLVAVLGAFCYVCRPRRRVAATVPAPHASTPAGGGGGPRGRRRFRRLGSLWPAASGLARTIWPGITAKIVVYWVSFVVYAVSIMLIQSKSQELFAKIITGVGVVLWLAYCNSDPYKLTFPGLTLYYPNEPSYGYGLVPLQQSGGDSDPSAATTPEAPPHKAILEGWKKHCTNTDSTGNSDGNGDGTRPKLVVVTVSGGALRSAVWTALVLEEIQKALDSAGAREGTFNKGVRLITGASGGMLGAAAYVANLYNPELFRFQQAGAIATPSGRKSAAISQAISAIRSLDAVSYQMALFDIPALFDMRGKEEDRGRALEATWVYLDQLTFGMLKVPELDGRLPSLVFTPMLVEDGRRLFVSNLDFEFLAKLSGEPLLLHRPGRTQATNAGTTAGPGADGALLSRPAIEMKKLFPASFPGFMVKTAVRMSATFPYVSPAVSLPTDPARSVVDAGYYDNFGVNLACSWIHAHRHWLQEHTGGVVLIQIRDHHGQESLCDFLSPSGAGAALRRSFDFLMSPVAGYMMSRYSSTSFRNDEQILSLHRCFQDDLGCPPEFFKSVIFEFENEADVALSWQLTDAEIKALHGAIKMPQNQRKLDALCQWW